MFDWFAARPTPEGTAVDRPTVPLTPAERDAFHSISEQIAGRSRMDPRLLARRAPSRTLASLRPSWSSLPLGIVLLVAGMAWTVGMLAVSVPASFAGVLAQAAGIGVVVRSQWHRFDALEQAWTDPGVRSRQVQDHRGPAR